MKENCKYILSFWGQGNRNSSPTLQSADTLSGFKTLTGLSG